MTTRSFLRLAPLFLAVHAGCAGGGGEPPAAAPERPAPVRPAPAPGEPQTITREVRVEVPVVEVREKVVEVDRLVPGPPADARAVILIAGGRSTWRSVGPDDLVQGALRFLLGELPATAPVALVSAHAGVGVVASLSTDRSELVRDLETLAAAGGPSDLDQALGAALSELDAAGVDRAMVIVLAPADADIGAPAPFERPGVAYHVVAPAAGGRPSQLLFLALRSEGRFHPAGGPAALDAGIFSLLTEASGHQSLLTRPSGEAAGESTLVPVDQSVEQLVLQLGGVPPFAFELKDPAGEVVLSGASGGTTAGWAAYRIDRPTAGIWTLEIADEENEIGWVRFTAGTDIRLTAPAWLPESKAETTRFPLVLSSPRTSWVPERSWYELYTGATVRRPSGGLAERSDGGAWVRIPLAQLGGLDASSVGCLRLRARGANPLRGDLVQREAEFCGFLTAEVEAARTTVLDPATLTAELPATTTRFRQNLQGNLRLLAGADAGLAPGMRCLVRPAAGAPVAYEGYISSALPASSICTITTRRGPAARLDPARAIVRIEDLALVDQGSP